MSTSPISYGYGSPDPVSNDKSNTTDPKTTDSSTTDTPDSLSDKDTFLKLLVAQLQHQDPLSPADGLQFVTQLAQFTSLEQTQQMRADLDSIKTSLGNLTPATPPATQSS